MNNHMKLIVMVITLSLILIVSSSYAILTSTKVGKNNYSISIGDLKVIFKKDQTEALNLTNIYPMTDEEGMAQKDVLSFTIENTGTVGSYYDISIEETSTNPEFKNVIKYISNKDDEGYIEPKVLSDNKYIELTGYVESGETRTYKVKAWLMEEADNTYMGKEFKAKLVVNAYQESNYAKDVIKSKLVKYSESSKEDFEGGLVAVNTDGELYNETNYNQEIREYRYSGSSVNNYVTFNDETWRILGIFKDEDGQELMKIVRNEVLEGSTLPSTYVVAERTFQIKYGENTVRWDFDGINFDNNWNDAGLMNWLNSKGITDGYLKTLSKNAQNMVAETKYYLGNVFYDDTVIQTYVNERKNIKCSVNSDSHNNNCYVWPNNEAIWKGKIALMYPSDLGFTLNSSYWSMKKLGENNSTFKNSSWLYKEANHKLTEWFLSPSSIQNDYVTYWDGDGYVDGNRAVRPSLYLKSNVKITSGDGTSDDAYILDF